MRRDVQLRSVAPVERDHELAVHVAQRKVGRDVVFLRRKLALAGFRIQALHQLERLFQLGVLEVEALAQLTEVLHRERLVVIVEHPDGVVAVLYGVGQGAELHEQAFLQIARGDADGIELLDLPQDALHVLLVEGQSFVEHNVVHDGSQLAAQVAVGIEGADDLIGDEVLVLVEIQHGKLIFQLLRDAGLRGHRDLAVVLAAAPVHARLVAVEIVGAVEQFFPVVLVFIVQLVVF